jgi:serine/threonine protein kinase
MDYGRVLLVDDDVDLGSVVRDYLLHEGYSVVYFANAVKAGESLASSSFDLIILDWELPDGSGVELCREYRSSGGLAPVLMMTGRKSSADKERGLDSGADDYITKPFCMRELLARVRSVLRRSRVYSKPPEQQSNQVVELRRGIVLSGKYELEESIAKGAYAVVWKARDTVLDRTVVVKIMHGKLSSDGDTASRFEHESRIMARINHPNVATIFDFGYVNGRQPCLFMEYLSGYSLRELVSQGPLALDIVAGIMIQICSGLQEAHDAGIVHSDLKPENVLIQAGLERSDAVKIVDFGLARLVCSKDRFVEEGMTVGTPDYMAPEQVMGCPADARSDIYSLGIMTFELLTGFVPFAAGTAQEKLVKHLSDNPPLLSALCSNIAPGSCVELIVKKCLQKEPKDRFQTVGDLSEAFKSML